MLRIVVSTLISLSLAVPAMAEDVPADYVAVKASHVKPNPDDPVMIKFKTFKIKKSNIKKKVVGSTLTLEIDLNSLSSGNSKRDAHLKNPDFLETSKFATATVRVSKVRAAKKAGTFLARAKVTAHGKTRTWPVTIKLVEDNKKSRRFSVRYTFKRESFGIGNAKAKGAVASNVTAEALLTLPK